MLSVWENKALIPSGLQMVHIKRWKQAGEEEAKTKDTGTNILDLTARVLSLIRVSGVPAASCPIPLLGQPHTQRSNIHLC